jgi:quinol monooxygenase YgiN
VSRITTIVHFSLLKENMDEFLAQWKKIKDVMLGQPGILDGTFHRSIDDNSPFQFVNVAHWESPEALANALRATAEECKGQGTDLAEVMQRLGVRVSQNNYVEEVTY